MDTSTTTLLGIGRLHWFSKETPLTAHKVDRNCINRKRNPFLKRIVLQRSADSTAHYFLLPLPQIFEQVEFLFLLSGAYGVTRSYEEMQLLESILQNFVFFKHWDKPNFFPLLIIVIDNKMRERRKKDNQSCVDGFKITFIYRRRDSSKALNHFFPDSVVISVLIARQNGELSSIISDGLCCL